MVELNLSLSEDPSLLKKSPEAEGWVVKIKASDPAEFEKLMSEEEYKKYWESLEIGAVSHDVDAFSMPLMWRFDGSHIRSYQEEAAQQGPCTDMSHLKMTLIRTGELCLARNPFRQMQLLSDGSASL